MSDDVPLPADWVAERLYNELSDLVVNRQPTGIILPTTPFGIATCIVCDIPLVSAGDPRL